MEPLTLKLVLALVMLLLTLVFGLLPIKVLKYLRKRAAKRGESSLLGGKDGDGDVASNDRGREGVRSRWPSLTLSLLSCFTGGVFLGTCFLHLLPEVNEHLTAIKADFHWHTDYPIGELLSCAGFFLIFFVEEVVVTMLQGGHGHSHGPILTNNESSVDAQARDLLKQQKANEDTDMKDVGDLNDGISEETALQASSETYENTQNEAAHLKLTKRTPKSPGKNGMTNLINVNKIDGINNNSNNNNNNLIDSPSSTSVIRCNGATSNCPAELVQKDQVRSITLILALSFHSVIEGLALGIAQTNGEVATLFLSLIIHKVIVAFSVGLQLARTHAHQLLLVIASICILACMSPLGCIIGIGVEVTRLVLSCKKCGHLSASDAPAARTSPKLFVWLNKSGSFWGQRSVLGREEQSALHNDTKELVMLIFEGMAVGTFLYVTFFEVFIHERDNEHPNMAKLLVIVIGFGIVAGLRTFEHNHGTSVGHHQYHEDGPHHHLNDHHGDLDDHHADPTPFLSFVNNTIPTLATFN